MFQGAGSAEAKSVRLKEKIAGLRRQMRALKVMEQTVQDAPDQQVSLTDPAVLEAAVLTARSRCEAIACTHSSGIPARRRPR